MNRSDLRTAVRTRLGNPSTDGFFTDANLNSLIDEAVLIVGAEGDWPWLQAAGTNVATVSGTATYSISDTGYTRTRVLVIDGQDPLIERPISEIRGIGTTPTGRPVYYSVVNSTLHLRPVPDAIYAIVHDITTSEVVLATDSDSPLLPAPFQFAIVAKAVELAHLRQNDDRRAAAHLAEYTNWLDRMRDNLRRTPPAPAPGSEASKK